MTNFKDKIEHSKKIIEQAVSRHKKIAVGCSFGKDSIATVHLAKQVKPQISVFYVATIFKPEETLRYAVAMNKEMNLNIKVYLACKEPLPIFKDAGIDVVLLCNEQFEEAERQSQKEIGKPLYQTNPDLCCQLLKVEPTKQAVRELDAWISGLRKTEGYSRRDFQEFEEKGGLIKVNPILDWTELDIWRYLAVNNIKPNPLYSQGYRSLGCAVCSKIISDQESERAGRWQNTSKCGGECGIHTKRLK